MRAVVQRVAGAKVTVDGRVVGEIDRGLLVFLGIGEGDGKAEADYLAAKIASLRIFTDEAGKFNLSAIDTGGQVLVVSQFTLYGDVKRGRRPSFTGAAAPTQASEMVDYFGAQIERLGLHVEKGQFQAHMMVDLVNDGPVTIWMDTAELMKQR